MISFFFRGGREIFSQKILTKTFKYQSKIPLKALGYQPTKFIILPILYK